jgi:hypothetical protein
LHSTVAWSFVSFCSGVGIKTLTAMNASFP